MNQKTLKNSYCFEGKVLVGSPVIDAKQYMKAYALFKRAAEE